MTSDRRFFSGDSLAQALNQAAQHFHLNPNEINYKVVDKKHGFLKVRRKVVIEVDGANAMRPEAAAASAPDAVGPRREKGTHRESSAVGEAEPIGARPETSELAPPTADDESGPSGFSSPTGPPEESTPLPPVEPSAAPPPRQPRATEPLPEAPAGTEAQSAVPQSDDPPAAEPRHEEELPRARRARRARPSREPAPSGPARSAPAAAKGVEFPEAPVPARSRYPAADGEEAKAAAEALELILALAALDLESEILKGEEELLVELWGEDQDILLRDRGRLLLAIQHLLPRVMRGLIGRSVPCKVDSDDFHMIREERLRDLAQRAADEVRRRGRAKTLEPMSPDERRIVHLTLADYPGVETESHGSGLFKRVMVRLTRGDKSRGPYRR